MQNLETFSKRTGDCMPEQARMPEQAQVAVPNLGTLASQLPNLDMPKFNLKSHIIITSTHKVHVPILNTFKLFSVYIIEKLTSSTKISAQNANKFFCHHKQTNKVIDSSTYANKLNSTLEVDSKKSNLALSSSQPMIKSAAK